MNVSFANRIKIAVILLALIIIAGTIGYSLIEPWSYLDCFYMTVITISTVGYSEIKPLSTGGEIFTIVLIIMGVGIMFYTVTMLAEYITASQFRFHFGRRKMEERINELNNHFIICGYGRVGRSAAATILEQGKPFVVIDVDQSVVLQASEEGCLAILGDITTDRVLKQAGIERAHALISALRNDADNVFVTLSARELRPDIFISARAFDEDSERKLLRAGANRVIFPHRLGGQRLAMATLRPEVLDFIDTAVFNQKDDLSLENLFVTPQSPISGMTVNQASSHCGGSNILAIKKPDGNLIANPSGDITIENYDQVMVIGNRDQLIMMACSL